jgi:hypothetical protein
VNRRSNRGLANDSDDLPVGSIIRLPARICILGVVSIESDVMSPYFFKKDTLSPKSVP